MTMWERGMEGQGCIPGHTCLATWVMGHFSGILIVKITEVSGLLKTSPNPHASEHK